MSMAYEEVKVISNERINKEVYKLVVESERDIKCGQFYMIKTERSLLPRPISICEKEGNELTFIYAVVGKGTEEMSTLKEGEKIKVTGPLGNGFDVSKDLGRVSIVAGGVGTAPMIQVCKELRKNNTARTIDVYAGFRDEVYLIDEFEKYGDSVNIATNTGDNGTKGFVTDILDTKKYDTVLCCGPEVMMKKVVEMCKESNTNVFVSMEKHMACGVGACLVCTCKTKDGNKRTCKDGPVFDGYYVEL
ncbi:dihydroorotate dehydrogenase electron transfer subunit [Clostridium sp.]|uniref:dihydroorotate dehydrogenase electron transfer subunit n=1 Tax=Clostridium sp. TaxID=1506 RepID=UPI002FC77A5E